MKKILMVLLVVVPFLLVAFGTLYFFGFRKYGSPTAFREQQQALVQAREDSIRALETMVAPVNVADSTLFGMNVQSQIIAGTKEAEVQIRTIQVSIDSLNRLSVQLDAREKTLVEREKLLQQQLAQIQNENTLKLVSLYNKMKTTMAVPIFIEMNDTLAVTIISQMEEEPAARLLGAIADKDVKKATILNGLLSRKTNGSK
jgi:flagellar motility protein MotE (MotC chaperone)